MLIVIFENHAIQERKLVLSMKILINMQFLILKVPKIETKTKSGILQTGLKVIETCVNCA